MRKTTLKLMSCLVALVMILSIMPSASALNTIRDMVTDKEVTFIVLLEDDCSVEKLAEAGLLTSANKQEELRNAAANVAKAQNTVAENIRKNIVGSGSIGYTYKAVINGFSMKANISDQAAIEAIPGVRKVFVSREHEVIEPVEQEEEITVSTEYSSVTTGVAEMQAEGYRGQGQVISIVDTTFDTNHEYLNGSVEDPKYSKDDMAELLSYNMIINASLMSDGGCQQITANQVWKSEKVPFAYNYIYGNADTYPRCGESVHGIHVAGIAAGKNGTLPNGDRFDGVAPEAQLFLMACPQLTDEATIAAIDDSVLLGADVINMSWGTDYWEMGTFAEIFANAREFGTYLCNAAGNSAMGWDETLPTADIVDYGSMGNPGETGYSTNVASSDNVKLWQEVCNITVNGETTVPYLDENEEHPFFEAFSDQEYDFVFVGEMNEDNIDVEGKIAVFDRGTHGYYYSDRVDVAIAGGAIGVIFLLTDGYSLSNYQISTDSVQDMPTAAVMYEHTDALRGTGKLISDAEPQAVLNPNGDEDNVQISSFSSWGVFDNLDLDPEITAPGGQIYSSVADDLYEVWSGTSMASPHMTGAVALMKQYLLANEENFTPVYGEPDEWGISEVVSGLTPAQQIEEIEARAMSTAKILTTYNPYSDIDGVPFSPRLQGAGLLQVPAAVTTPVVLIGESGRTKVELRDGITNNITFTFSAKNLTDKAVVYDVNDIIVTTNDYMEYDGQYYVLDSCIPLETISKTMPKTIKVPANGTNEIAVNIKLDPEQVDELEKVFTNGFFVDGFVVLGTSDESVPTLSIPFMGFHGDWEAQHILDSYVYDGNSYTGQTRLGSGEEHGYTQTELQHYVDSCDTLGTNFFYNNYPESMYAENFDPELEYDSDSFSAISPNGDGMYDYLCASTITLRRTDAMWIEIYDAEGNMVYTVENEETVDTEDTEWSVPRFYPTGVQVLQETFDELELGEGDYTVKLYAQRGDHEPEMVEMPFSIDNTAPKIESWEIYTENVEVVDYQEDENGEFHEVTVEQPHTFIKINASDDKNLMGIALAGTRDGMVLYGTPIAGGEEGEAIFDITNDIQHEVEDEEGETYTVGSDHFTIYAIDYAWNQDMVVTDAHPGDINEDGNIDNQDLVILARIIAEIDSWDALDGYQQWVCDFNGDYYVDNVDLVMMARYIAGFDNYTEVPEIEEPVVEEPIVEEPIAE